MSAPAITSAAWTVDIADSLTAIADLMRIGKHVQARPVIAGTLAALESAGPDLLRDPLSAVVAADAVITAAVWCGTPELFRRAVLVRLALIADSAP